jgi:hypothetical protein
MLCPSPPSSSWRMEEKAFIIFNNPNIKNRYEKELTVAEIKKILSLSMWNSYQKLIVRVE